MPNETILQQIRTPLATALSTVAGNVYSFVPETDEVNAAPVTHKLNRQFFTVNAGVPSC